MFAFISFIIIMSITPGPIPSWPWYPGKREGLRNLGN